MPPTIIEPPPISWRLTPRRVVLACGPRTASVLRGALAGRGVAASLALALARPEAEVACLLAGLTLALKFANPNPNREE